VLVATHVHSVYGTTLSPDVFDAVAPEVIRCLDCAHSAGRMPLDVRSLGADFAVAAGHKMFAPPGVGVVYCAPRTHARLRPFLPGGAGADAADERMPGLLEGGTANVPAIAGLAAALGFIADVGIDRIAAHSARLTRRMVTALTGVAGVELLGVTDPVSGIVSFRIAGMRSADVGFVLSSAGISARAGGHCTLAGDDDAIRLSVHAYTTQTEVDRATELVIRLAQAGR
jgi:cysteine desulfurase/selenocysteine lyase